jgi:hypothetical protein
MATSSPLSRKIETGERVPTLRGYDHFFLAWLRIYRPGQSTVSGSIERYKVRNLCATLDCKTINNGVNWH